MVGAAEVSAGKGSGRSSSLLTFVVAGGNYAGIEVACDLVDYFRFFSRTRYPELKFHEFRWRWWRLVRAFCRN